MGAGQRIIRLRCMIEIPEFPSGGIVADTTFTTRCSLVPIVLFMAGEAVRFGVFECRRAMACVASDLRMTAYQREHHQNMNEAHICRPIDLGMTTSTCRSMLSSVRARQRKPCPAVIEGKSDRINPRFRIGYRQVKQNDFTQFSYKPSVRLDIYPTGNLLLELEAGAERLTDALPAGDEKSTSQFVNATYRIDF